MITKELLQNFRSDFAKAVEELEKQYGLVIKLGNITYGFDSFTGKIEVKEGASKEEVAKKDFEQNCSAVGLYPDDYLMTFTGSNGKKYQIIGVDLKKRKYPIIIRNVDTGETSRCTKNFIN